MVEQLEALQELSDEGVTVFVFWLNLSSWGEKYCMVRAGWRGKPELGIFALRGRGIRVEDEGFIRTPHQPVGGHDGMDLWGIGQAASTRSSPGDEEEAKRTQACGQLSS